MAQDVTRNVLKTLKETTEDKVMATKKSSSKTTGRRQTATTAWLDEFEHATVTVLSEVKNNLEFVRNRITKTAGAAAETAAETTSAFKERVSGNEMTKQWHHVLQEIEAAGDGLMDVVGKRLDGLRAQVHAATAKPAGKKKSSKKKAAAKKKVVAKKKATMKNKAATKKKTGKAGAPKTAAKKKTKASAKLSVRKKSARKKT